MGAIVLLLIGSGLWLHSQKGHFASMAAAYETQLRDEFKTIDGQPASTDAYKSFLHLHEAALTAILANEPKPTHLLWITAAPSAKAKRVAELSKAAGNLRDAMAEYHEFLVFRDGVLEAVRNSGGKITTIDQLHEAKTRLEANQKSIKNLRPPTGLKAYQQTKVAMFNTPLSTLETALVAYEKDNPNLFSDSVALLSEEVKAISLPQTASELMNMHEYYEAMSKAYDALDKLLQ